MGERESPAMVFALRVWRARWVAAATCVVVLAATATYYKLAPRRYSATAIIAVEPSPRLADLSQFNDLRILLPRTRAIGHRRHADFKSSDHSGWGRSGANHGGPISRHTCVWINANARSARRAADWANGLARVEEEYNPSRKILVIRDVQDAACRRVLLSPIHGLSG